MRFRSTAFLVLVLFVPCLRTPAQVGIYGKFDLTRFSIASSNTEHIQSTAWLYGPTAGIYCDFLHLGPVSVGADVRGNYSFGNSEKYRNLLFGGRLAVKPPALPIKPYIQASVGLAGTSSSAQPGPATHFSNKFAYEVLGGLDMPVWSHMDWRVVELGYGRVSAVSSFAGTSSNSVILLSTGIVLRLP